MIGLLTDDDYLRLGGRNLDLDLEGSCSRGVPRTRTAAPGNPPSAGLLIQVGRHATEGVDSCHAA